jgi:hypothetical protein
MSDSVLAFLTWVVITALTVTIAWNTAAYELAASCEKLGSFYLGDKVYKCEVVK